ncbi:MAG: hypothetical protein OET79_15055, partial [Nitrospirota bacterium]|nr:hypothetical protein [Nitrospirota bacterium]
MQHPTLGWWATGLAVVASDPGERIVACPGSIEGQIQRLLEAKQYSPARTYPDLGNPFGKPGRSVQQRQRL